ncbi:D-alanyl-D-alanine carboxypeptidase family protein [Orenia marismortui]|uniref:serine-type D-Ala-D-Ala carboxypeptidase n=1 Tax=Orenia marismortui TaxID=46469 RepID=A0A4R8H8L4_9FIRM|nr:D-alanyl-D-alanine carboxypeptidase family protein [Orenia marismortui]TDX51177.1 D-alanyl-D-alanine carboxypeptidase (penicillin-binding protein 5/6) [Orenia marismortui]
MKKSKRIIGLSLLLVFIFSQVILAIDKPEFNLESKSAILMDAKTGKILYEKNPHQKLPPASITKIMTMLLAMEAIDQGRADWKDKISTSEFAAQMGGSQIWLEPGEEMTLQDLLKAVAVVSANDACVAIAEYLYGTEENFVKAMNDKAKELGMKHTYFYNTNGLPPTDPKVEGNHTTAYDISLMSRELLKHKKILEFTSIWIDHLRDGESFLRNTNNLVRFFKGADGLKTGYTQEAGFCLSSTARKGGMRFIAVVMNAPNSKLRFKEARELLSYAFSIHKSIDIVAKGAEVTKVKVFKGESQEIDAIAKDDLQVAVIKGDEQEVVKQTRINKDVVAPVKSGDKVGEIVVLKGEEELGRVDLVAKQGVEKANFFKIIVQIFKRFISKLMNVF